MFDVNLIFLIAFSLLICYGAGLYYRQLREGRGQMSRPAYRKKIASICLGTAGVLIWFGCGFLYLHYDGTRPTTADESAGRVYSISNHGHIVFLTLIERCYLFLLGIIAFASFVGGYILDRRAGESDSAQ